MRGDKVRVKWAECLTSGIGCCKGGWLDAIACAIGMRKGPHASAKKKKRGTRGERVGQCRRRGDEKRIEAW